jgi:aldehyde dehydrogenase (NAD+)
MREIFSALGLSETNSGVWTADGGWSTDTSGPLIESVNPATGELLGKVRGATAADYERLMASARKTFDQWRLVPGPKRGEVVRLVADELRANKDALGSLVTLETGKIKPEGDGEVQEMIDIGDFAVGQSRMLYGSTMHSERPLHRMYEQWHPLGPVGIVTAFNFPVAVWAWNAMVAAVCGDSMIWKPSHQAPLTAIAVTRIADRVLKANGAPPIFNLAMGGRAGVGERLVGDHRVPLISATGSTRMGREVGRVLADRFGRSLLELGGNNGILVMDDADLDLALRAVLFAAVGTAGQRCTTLRRLIIHESIADAFSARLAKAYKSIQPGNPWDDGVLLGPLIRETAADQFEAAIAVAQQQGGKILAGGSRIKRPGYYVQPTLIAAHGSMEIVKQETFAPILYVLPYKTLDEAIALHNAVPQGLSSAIFTSRFQEAERFLSAAGSDCGIANVNIGTSGAEIGGAFGGEKETGGGREAGSDAWKAYMRRQTCTLNYGDSLPLAQGVKFDVDAAP